MTEHHMQKTETIELPAGTMAALQQLLLTYPAVQIMLALQQSRVVPEAQSKQDKDSK